MLLFVAIDVAEWKKLAILIDRSFSDFREQQMLTADKSREKIDWLVWL